MSEHRDAGGPRADLPQQPPPFGSDDRSKAQLEPVGDLDAIAADDELLTRLGRGVTTDALTWDDEPLPPPSRPPIEPQPPQHPARPRDAALRLLAAWRDDLDEGLEDAVHRAGVTLPEPDDTDAEEPPRRGLRLLPRTAVAAGLAAIVFSAGGVAAAAVAASPHSWLYPLHRVLVGTASHDQRPVPGPTPTPGATPSSAAGTTAPATSGSSATSPAQSHRPAGGSHGSSAAPHRGHGTQGSGSPNHAHHGKAGARGRDHGHGAGSRHGKPSGNGQPAQPHQGGSDPSAAPSASHPSKRPTSASQARVEG